MLSWTVSVKALPPGSGCPPESAPMTIYFSSSWAKGLFSKWPDMETGVWGWGRGGLITSTGTAGCGWW